MTKQGKIREDLDTWFLERTMWSIEARKKNIDSLLTLLSSHNVVIKSDDQTLPKNNRDHYTDRYVSINTAYRDGQTDMKQAGFVQVEPITGKEANIENCNQARVIPD